MNQPIVAIGNDLSLYFQSRGERKYGYGDHSHRGPSLVASLVVSLFVRIPECGWQCPFLKRCRAWRFLGLRSAKHAHILSRTPLQPVHEPC